MGENAKMLNDIQKVGDLEKRKIRKIESQRIAQKRYRDKKRIREKLNLDTIESMNKKISYIEQENKDLKMQVFAYRTKVEILDSEIKLLRVLTNGVLIEPLEFDLQLSSIEKDLL